MMIQIIIKVICIGLAERSRSNLFGGETLRHFYFHFYFRKKGLLIRMKELSIFVDESGDFGVYSSHSPYYIVTMVFHNQTQNLTQDIKILDKELTNLGYQNHVVHTEPLIRREEKYQYLLPNERRAIFSKLFHFVIKSNIQYKSFIFRKKQLNSSYLLEIAMIKELTYYMQDNQAYFMDFDNAILYYDNGQHELTKILKKVLSATISNYETRKITPDNYRLFQAADLICTLTLLEKKIESRELSKSEKLIFHSKKALKKDFLKSIHKKQL